MSSLYTLSKHTVIEFVFVDFKAVNKTKRFAAAFVIRCSELNSVSTYQVSLLSTDEDYSSQVKTHNLPACE